jgi:hypothetical protein
MERRTFDFTDMTKIDCLVCHDTTGTYKKTPTAAGMPDPKVDLVNVAKNVGHTSRKTCGDCHFNGGGGEAVKHADLSRQLLQPERSCDIHMGGYDFQCTDCHRTRNHKIAGRSSSVPVTEGRLSCEGCHTDKPHYGDGLLDHHLNKHSDTIACTTCHAPVYAKCKPTKTWWDWSKAGDTNRKAKKDKYGMGDYHWKKGEFIWKESPKPVYRWYGGFMERVLLGDKIDMDAEWTDLTKPVGSINDPRSKISPFKIMGGVQPVDQENHYLLVPHLYPKGKRRQNRLLEAPRLAESLRHRHEGGQPALQRQVRLGEDAHVLGRGARGDAGQHGPVLRPVPRQPQGRTHLRPLPSGQPQMWTSSRSPTRAPTSATWLSKGRDVRHLIGSTDYIDFKSLGYKGDPVIHGGRFKKLPMGYKAHR